VEDWVTIANEPLWKVDLLRTVLEEQGIPAFLPDHTTKIVDPFITGASPLYARLQVPASQAEHAKAVLAARAEPRAEPAEEDEESEEALQEDLERVARRTRWGSIIWIGWPFALLAGTIYVAGCRETGLRAKHHKLTILAWAWALTNLVALLVLIVLWITGRLG
jgi:hypothetical protein